MTARGERLRRDPAFPALRDAVIALTGLGYWSDKEDMLADLLAAVTDRRQEQAGRLLQRLQGEAGRGPASDAVADAVTVGETFFFRYQAQFEALAQVVVPDIIARRRAVHAVAAQTLTAQTLTAQTLTAWSAGCSNGAEPYSLSMLLRGRFATELAGWRIDILGTDISPAALAVAEVAEYGAWTIRDLSQSLRQDCFDHHDGRWRLKARFRQDVRFALHNLVAQPPPGFGFDVVLCRNVLMYFAPPVQARVVQSLRAALAPGGWLLVSHAEVGAPLSDVFEARVLPHCTLYRRSEDG